MSYDKKTGVLLITWVSFLRIIGFYTLSFSIPWAIGILILSEFLNILTKH